MSKLTRLLVCALALSGVVAWAAADAPAESKSVAARYQVRERTTRFFQRSTSSSVHRS